MPSLSPIDQLITHVDTFIKTTTGSIGHRDRPSPAETMPETELSAEERAYSARLMRINHCGEVCAQALYHGQALTARDTRTSSVMQRAAAEESDHLAWCEQRIQELDSHVSFLNPIWYAASFSMGALTGLLGDKINLGFIAATEQEVCRHLDEHLEKLPPHDEKSRAVLRQMRVDESRHATTAMEHGGTQYPESVKSIMRQVSKLMTRSTYWV
ncbi:MAG: 2-polyprenyl-3-methyl-6-methoxy-1,4-benzoquinone monooxygenase [Gammaproteobacteria bacterium]|nr:2-polyprenyl-3-methyl-6-methoxy-1,4-benzoquinone monooxygenase [Gammaproteobacteria bacterium]